MDRVFLDTNVVFSAAYSEDADFQRLWQIPDIQLIVSTYVVEEALNNITRQDRLERLDRLLSGTEIIDAWEHVSLPDDVSLVDKDIPILQAAIAAQATHLITGDKRDFGLYFGHTISGVTVLLPATYLRNRL